jgi:hypothetical protein
MTFERLTAMRKYLSKGEPIDTPITYLEVVTLFALAERQLVDGWRLQTKKPRAMKEAIAHLREAGRSAMVGASEGAPGQDIHRQTWRERRATRAER